MRTGGRNVHGGRPGSADTAAAPSADGGARTVAAEPAGRPPPRPFGPTPWPPAPHPVASTWPLRGSHLRRWCYAYLVLAAVTSAVGGVILLAEPTALGALDVDAARWLADRRTERNVTWAHRAGNLSDGFTVVPLVAVAAAGFVWRWRRWQEASVLIAALVLEKSVFLTATLLLRRDRPPVPHLDGEPVTFSYPSGHVAAAVVAYGVLGLVLLWHLDHGPGLPRVVARGGAALLGGLVPAVVAVGRLHLGMHHLSDVVAGALLGGAAVLVVVVIVRDGSIARWQERSAPVPHRPAG